MNSFDCYKLFITPLSPIHIGTGESYEPTNYVIEGDTLYAFDTGSVIEAFGERERQQLLNAVNQRPGTEMIVAVQKFFYEHRMALLASAVHRIPVLDGVVNLYHDRVGQVAQREPSGHAVVNRLEIDRAACNPVTRLPLLFGSSLKGAIRTALLDKVNGGQPLQRVIDSRNKGERDERNIELQQRLFRYRAGKFELDPLRLIQISDAVWKGESGLPATEVHLAVNRKKAPIVDEKGVLRKSMAEQKGLNQILECVPPMRYRTFTAQLNIQRVNGVSKETKLPHPDLRFGIRHITDTCNAFYRPILLADNTLLTERGYVSERWRGTIELLLNGELGRKMDNGEALLLRVGRHSGAESVTLNGVRDITIMKGKGQQLEKAPSVKTVWLAAEEGAQQQDMLPFGWLLVEIHPMNGALPKWDILRTACDAHLEPARAWAVRQTEKAAELEQARAERAARRQNEEAEAHRRTEGMAHAAAVSYTDKVNEARSVSPGPTVEQWPHAQLGWNKGKGELTALYENKKSFSPSGQGRAMFERLSEEIRKRLDKGKTVPVNVTVEAAGRNWVIVSLEGPSA